MVEAELSLSVEATAQSPWCHGVVPIRVTPGGVPVARNAPNRPSAAVLPIYGPDCQIPLSAFPLDVLVQ